MSDKENECDSGLAAFKKSLGSSFGKRRKRNTGFIRGTQLLAAHHRAVARRGNAPVPQLPPQPITHAPRRDTRPPGSRVRRRKTAAHSAFGIEIGDCLDFSSRFAPEEAEKPSEDVLWARGRQALFEQRLRAEPCRDDRTLGLLRCAFSSAQQPPVPFVPCSSCRSGSQSVIIISMTSVVKVLVQFVACAPGCVAAAVPVEPCLGHTTILAAAERT